MFCFFSIELALHFLLFCLFKYFFDAKKQKVKNNFVSFPLQHLNHHWPKARYYNRSLKTNKIPSKGERERTVAERKKTKVWAELFCHLHRTYIPLFYVWKYFSKTCPYFPFNVSQL